MEKINELRKQAMKKRLNSWSSFFDRIESGEFLDTVNAKEASIIDDSLCDPTFIAVDQEHSKIREALCKANGISEKDLCEPSPESGDDSSHDASDASDASDSGGDKLCGISKEKSKSPKRKKRSPSTNSADRNNKSKQQPGVSVKQSQEQRKYKSNHDLSMTKSPKEIDNHSSRTPFQICRKPNKVMGSALSPSQNAIWGCRPTSEKGKSTVKSSEHCNDDASSNMHKHTTEDLKGLKTMQSLPLREIWENNGQKSTDKIPSLNSPCRQQKPDEQEVLSPNWTPKMFLLTSTPKERAPTEQDASSVIDHIKDQPVCHFSPAEIREQYALYKSCKRRKSGKFGSLHIVSSLDEELSEANRYVPRLPPVVKNPISVSRRFSLKKQVF